MQHRAYLHGKLGKSRTVRIYLRPPVIYISWRLTAALAPQRVAAGGRTRKKPVPMSCDAEEQHIMRFYSSQGPGSISQSRDVDR